LSYNKHVPRTLATAVARHLLPPLAAIEGWEEVEDPTVKLPIILLEPEVLPEWPWAVESLIDGQD
jgi:hypothetical protein